MLIGLTNEDALRLIRKATLKRLLNQLMLALEEKLTQLDVQEEAGQWHSVSSLNHQLSRHFNPQGECSDWALWSDFGSMHPLFIGSWYWWQPLLQGVLNAQSLPQARSQSLSLIGVRTQQIGTVLAALHTRGIDECLISHSSDWKPLLDPLPVSVQVLSDKESIGADCLVLPDADKPIRATDWYVLFRLLYRLSDELCVGHRVDLNQSIRSADQALDRIITY